MVRVLAVDAVACLDVGSPAKGNVGWAVLSDDRRRAGGDLSVFVGHVVDLLAAGQRVAVGFECPLYVPKRADMFAMSRRRAGEERVNWCGGPGASVLAIGLAQVNWCLARIAERVPTVRGTTRWAELVQGSANLFCWEAFITRRAGICVQLGDADGLSPHERDALCGAMAFAAAIADGSVPMGDFAREDAFSLAGLHLLETGLSDDITLLSEPCLVLKVRKPT
ncbi:hypothetical protein [Arenimonas composti]|uniref:DUF429 domain-containing protein n=1 Tax=Arenimonas composti TR7-09 = DSM 18010 TaxID=1121013 RepID=A0A091BES1_9GAMM|nr:hypothetical protein [Arenimonas composti]KFN49309.1 hypothetical protein P873_11080 [Arenimonas composti TR7-09 = DSM 18010]